LDTVKAKQGSFRDISSLQGCDGIHNLYALRASFGAGIAGYTAEQLRIQAKNLFRGGSQLGEFILGSISREKGNLGYIHIGFDCLLAGKRYLQFIIARLTIDGTTGSAGPPPASTAPDEPVASIFHSFHNGKPFWYLITFSHDMYRNKLHR